MTLRFLTLALPSFFPFFFFNDTATTEIYTLSLHDALPISIPGDQRSPRDRSRRGRGQQVRPEQHRLPHRSGPRDRKSTRLNSSHGYISYAVFCLKKKKEEEAASINRHRCHPRVRRGRLRHV